MRSPVGRARIVAAVLCGLLACLCVVPASVADATDDNPEAAARDPDYAAGKQATTERDWPRAVAHFRKALLRYPDNADLHNHLGHAYRNLRQFPLAFEHYHRALAISPRHRGAHEYIGEAYLMTGNPAEAVKHLAALREICLLPCDELKDLEKAVGDYGAKAAKR